jgi:CheY-like chemotaxis protein
VSPLDILLADDVETNRELALAILSRHGHRVTMVTNGVEAVEAYAAGRFDVVLMDVQMPEMDGLSATRAIRELEARSGQRTPVLALTAYASETDREKCLRAGMDGHITKPFRSRELFAVLREKCCNGAVAPVSEESTSALSDGAVPVFDRQGLLERLGGRGELIAKFIAMFRTTLETRWDGVTEAVANQDIVAIRLHAHSLKGAAANIGAERIRGISQRIEAVADDGNFNETASMITCLKEEIDRFCDETRGSGRLFGD